MFYSCYNEHKKYFFFPDTDSIRHFGGGTGYVVLDDVQCLGSEASLSECPHITEGNHDCRQLENIGIKCQHGEKISVCT